MFQNCLKWVVYISTVSSCSYHLDRTGMLLKFLRILITVMYFKKRNLIFKTVNCIGCSVVYKIVFCSEFPEFPDNAGNVTRRTRRRRRRRRTQKRNKIMRPFEKLVKCFLNHEMTLEMNSVPTKPVALLFSTKTRAVLTRCCKQY